MTCFIADFQEKLRARTLFLEQKEAELSAKERALCERTEAQHSRSNTALANAEAAEARVREAQLEYDKIVAAAQAVATKIITDAETGTKYECLRH